MNRIDRILADWGGRERGIMGRFRHEGDRNRSRGRDEGGWRKCLLIPLGKRVVTILEDGMDSGSGDSMRDAGEALS